MNYMEKEIQMEVNKCLICNDPECSNHCQKSVSPAKKIRSIKFSNEKSAMIDIDYENDCKSCTAICESKCIRNKIDSPVKIKKIMEWLSHGKDGLNKSIEQKKIDLSYFHCGIKFENPFLLSSSSVTINYEMCARALDQGWGGLVFKTIPSFLPIEASPRIDTIKDHNNNIIGLKNIEQISTNTLEKNFTTLKRLKNEYPNKVIVSSIMGENEKDWEKLSELSTNTGVDCIECNFSCPQMTEHGLGSDIGKDPELVSKYTRAVRSGTHLPIFAKMTPNIEDMASPAIAAIEAGATGISLINTIKCIMNVNINTFVSGPNVQGKSCVGGYSGKAIKPIALKFLSSLSKDSRLKNIPISGMGGIETYKDALEFILLGASSVQLTTSVMEYGYRIIDDLIEGLSIYMQEKGFSSVNDIIGLGINNIIDPDKIERETIELLKFDRSKCIGCGRCYISCQDGGHQAIKWENKNRTPTLNTKKCVGCHLCISICPMGAIKSSGKRVIKKF